MAKKTVTISGIRYKHTSCSKNKGAMKARAASRRKAGYRARVLKVGTNYCLYVGGRRKKKMR